jgi:hypothetical protein
MDNTVLSFYCDDTNADWVPVEAFTQFLDFLSAEGVKGESSVLLGIGWSSGHGLLSQPKTPTQKIYIEQLHRAAEHDLLDANMEIMTHEGRFDFANGVVPEGAIHEGLWLHEPEVPTDAYQDYFGHIIAEGERIGVRFSGLTWPGCGCEACTHRYEELRQAGHTEVNPNVWRALLNLAKQGKFRSHTVPCFPDGTSEQGPVLMARDEQFGVYDFSPNAGDQLGSYTNGADRANPDSYISEDGQSGRIVELVRAGAPYCLFYAHWQGMNPATGVGWDAFTTMVKRVRTHLGARVTWQRPSAYTDSLIR